MGLFSRKKHDFSGHNARAAKKEVLKHLGNAKSALKVKEGIPTAKNQLSEAIRDLGVKRGMKEGRDYIKS